MSLEAYVWAANLPLTACSGTAYRVLLMLADRVDPLGYAAWPSVKSMAETLDCSERTVRRATKELVDVALIREGDQRHVEHLRGGNRPTVYDLLTPALRYAESGPDIHVPPAKSRGDRSGHRDLTTGVHRTVLEPTYRSKPGNLSLVTARDGRKAS